MAADDWQQTQHRVRGERGRGQRSARDGRSAEMPSRCARSITRGKDNRSKSKRLLSPKICKGSCCCCSRMQATQFELRMQFVACAQDNKKERCCSFAHEHRPPRQCVGQEQRKERKRKEKKNHCQGQPASQRLRLAAGCRARRLCCAWPLGRYRQSQSAAWKSPQGAARTP